VWYVALLFFALDGSYQDFRRDLQPYPDEPTCRDQPVIVAGQYLQEATTKQTARIVVPTCISLKL